MTNLVHRSFGFPLKVLHVLGYFPPIEYSLWYHVYSNAVYFLCVVPTVILAATNLFKGDLTLDKVSENAFIVFQLGSFSIKLWPFLRNTALLRESLHMIESPIFTSYSTKQEIMIAECVKICNRNCLLFLTCCSCAFITWVSAPLFGSEMRLPVEVWLPANVKENSVIFYMAYGVLAIGVCNGCQTSAVVDPLLSGLLCHASYQLKILKDNLENLDEIGNSEESRNSVIYEKLARCVEHHKAILRFVATFEQTFSTYFFVQFLVSIVVVCISCLQLSMVEPFTFSFFAMLSFLITMLSELFFYCYYGTVLFEESNTVVDAAYFGNWYDYDQQSKKTLLIFMERLKIPITVTAGKLLNLSLDTFTTILRKAYSLLAVLKNI